MGVNNTEANVADKLAQALRAAMSYITWTAFGSCRSPGWPGPPPTAREAADAIEALLAERDALAARLAPVEDEGLEEIAAHCEATFDGWPFSSLERLSQDVYRVRAHQLLASIRPHIEAAERERCAKKIEPTGPRPCDCDSCDCGNKDDAERVAAWDEAMANAAAIRSGK